jgi:SAM-dependent methyltransferase
MMNGSIYAAVLGTAMELGIFWRLSDRALPAEELAKQLHIPVNRCNYLILILGELGLLEHSSGGYAPSAMTRKTILEVQSQDTWAFQAREDRDLALYIRDLALNISKPRPDWQVRNPTPLEYIEQLKADPIYAARLTRKLYLIHRSLADELANLLDLEGVNRLLDLGGGSGVVSFALLRKREEMEAVVMDFARVCEVGSAVAEENKLEKRVTYLPGDFLEDDLPRGFDMVMLCDVGISSESLFRKIGRSLNENGRLVVVDKFAPSRSSAPPSRLVAAFVASIESAEQFTGYVTVEDVRSELRQAGFQDCSEITVPHKDNLPWNIDWTMLIAQK